MLVAVMLILAVQADPLVGRASVIDGDTLEIQGQRVRLWGVDAPEGRQTCERAGRPYRCGQEAANALADWTGQRTVRCTPRGRPDRYRRIVATCAVNGTDMGAWLVRSGHALDNPAYSRGRYANDQWTAERGQRGVWAGTFVVPWEWRRTPRL